MDSVCVVLAVFGGAVVGGDRVVCDSTEEDGVCIVFVGFGGAAVGGVCFVLGALFIVVGVVLVVFDFVMFVVLLVADGLIVVGFVIVVRYINLEVVSNFVMVECSFKILIFKNDKDDAITE